MRRNQRILNRRQLWIVTATTFFDNVQTGVIQTVALNIIGGVELIRESAGFAGMTIGNVSVRKR